MLKKKVWSAKQKQLPSNKLGIAGEERAQKFLIDLGYKILETNLSWPGGEIDIIAFDINENEIVFVEVKTRRSSQFSHPASAVNRKKLYALIKTAQLYLAKRHFTRSYRFDIISISPAGLEHLKNVTWLN